MTSPKQLLSSLLLVLVGTCAACSSEGDPFNEPLEGKLSNNGLVLDLSVLDALTTTALTADEGVVDEDAFGELLASENGEELFSYLATCALDEDQELRVASTGAVYTGTLGLAPTWIDGACDSSCQRWVTACVLGHTNDLGESVQISPRGRHESLAWNKAIEEDFSYEEAAYYGNLFLPQGLRYASVCAGESLIQDSFDIGEDTAAFGENFIAGRIATGGNDEISFAGLCGSFTVVEVPIGLGACSSDDGYYEDCLLSAEDPADALTNPRVSEVITIFLQR